MMNFHKIAAASKGRLLMRYFTEDTPEPIHPSPLDAFGRQLDAGGRLTAYYTSRDSRATWRPDMPAIFAQAIGIDPRQMPRDDEMTRLFEGRRADTGEAWSGRRRKLSGLDLVFSPHKSVSLAAEFAATAAESAAFCNAVDRANDRAMRYVAHELGWARKGKGGEDGADPGAVGWISFRHHTARPSLLVQDGRDGQTYMFDAPVAGDPHLHIHNFLMNVVVTAEGRVGSLDTKALTDARVKTFGAYFQAFLADELRRLGVEVGYDQGEQAVIVLAIPPEVSKAFSKGRRQIVEKAKSFAREQGLDWNDISAEQKMNILRNAGAEGRLGKMKTDERRIWREQAAALGWQHTTAMNEVVHEALTDTERFDLAYQFAARHLAEEFRTAATITHEKLGMYAARGLIGTGIAGPDDIRRVVELLEARGVWMRGEHVALVTGLWDGMLRVTNTAQVRIEQSVTALAREAARDRSGALSVEALRAAIECTGVNYTAEQRAAIHALGEGGPLTLLTGVAGAGKTTLLEPLVDAWRSDRRFGPSGRQVVGAAMAWRQATALQDAGITDTIALSPLLAMIERGEFKASRNTVLVLDEVSQIGPRPMLKLLELQVKTGMTIKMLGDREQAQAIEAGDSIELLRRALPPDALPELLTTLRQTTLRGRRIAGLFREGEAGEALAMKRADGHALLVGGDREQVIAEIADLYIARRDVLLSGGRGRSITVSAPTNDDAAEISEAIRSRLKARGEIAGREWVHEAIDQAGRTCRLRLAAGDAVRLFRRTWGAIDGRDGHVGDNGDVVTIVSQDQDQLRVRTKSGKVADIEWRRLLDGESGRLLLGHGYALTINSAQGITSDEHINALPRGTAGITGFTSYVAESRARGTTWTMISEGALYEAEKHRQAIGDVTPITREGLWARAAEDMSEKPYKGLGIDLLGGALRDRERAIDTFIAASHHIESAQLDDPDVGPKVVIRLQAAAVNQTLGRHIAALDRAMTENEARLGDISRLMAANAHLRGLRTQAAAAADQLAEVAPEPARPLRGPSM